MPKISVLISSYNHADFIGKTIESVLQQSYQDFEIIISDDASTDETISVVNAYLEKDSRIRFFRFEKNRIEHMKNHCLQHASGEYIAILNSDDVFHPEKLLQQFNYLENHGEIGAVFTGVEWIDENGKKIEGRDHIFTRENRSRHEWLQHFYRHGNCLCHSSVMMRKSLLDKVGYYNRWQALMSDLDLWIRICLEQDIHILPEAYTYNRLLSGEKNASGARPEIQHRFFFEQYTIAEHYYSDNALSQLHKIFPEIPVKVSAEDIEKEYYLSLHFLNSSYANYRFYALNRLYELYRQSDVLEKLTTKITPQIIPDFYHYSAKTEILPITNPILEVKWSSEKNNSIKTDKVVYSLDATSNFIFSIPDDVTKIHIDLKPASRAINVSISKFEIIDQEGNRIKNIIPELSPTGAHFLIERTDALVRLVSLTDSFSLQSFLEMENSIGKQFLSVRLISTTDLSEAETKSKIEIGKEVELREAQYYNLTQNLVDISAKRLLSSLVKKLLRRIKLRT